MNAVKNKFGVPIYIITIVIVCAILIFFFLKPSSNKPRPVEPVSATSIPVVDLIGPEEAPQSHYIEIIDACGPYYDTGVCVNMRTGPGTEYKVHTRLRTGVVLKVATTTTTENGQSWYKVVFSTPLLYPERVSGDLYVVVDPTSVSPFTNEGNESVSSTTASTTKRIVVSVSEEMLYAYDGDTLFMKEPISTGLELTPTAIGTFTVFKKTPSRYMQGPIPGVSGQVYDLPGVPWDLYFTRSGAVIHGAYWHDHFGKPWSHGCINLSPQNAKKLYLWADVGMPVTVRK